ncbi:lanthionine synthetase LanC family protein [Nocardioides sp. MAHUQ-72]|uniref:lanthionine synthetase LanC family protein n=1 Tax=unclassified Nocardioides TaxID=2615069 RepID=UPI0036150261
MPTEGLALAALEWLAASGRPEGDGTAWTGTPDRDAADPDLYAGGAGIVLAFLEAHRHFGDDRWGDVAVRGARTLARQVEHWDHASLYFGATGMAVALHAVAGQLGERDAEAAARRALDRVRASFDGERWGPMFELMGGNAGIALGALRLGDVGLAETAVVPYLRTAEATPHGVTWENRVGLAARRHHLSHGTLGVAYALAATADATGRADLMDLALAGVADVVARDETGEAGFLVPHSDPQQQHQGIERFSFGWCHGPAGDAQVFRLLRRLTRDDRWSTLEDRCWHTVLGSGLPQRLRPGFWDNNGRCCGTAGVLALALDRAVERGDGRDLADLLVVDLEARATVDADGARWSNHEHRADPPELAPRHGWAMGNAGIVRELLRHARVLEGRDPAYAVAWPDHPPAEHAR